MKNLLLKVVFMPTILLFCNTLIAQKDEDNITPYKAFETYLDPNIAGFAPIVISIADANQEAINNTDATGFSHAYFSKTEIASLTANSECVGVRFYNAIKKARDGVQIIAVGVKTDGSEYTGQYVLSQDVSKGIIQSMNISMSQANNAITNIANSGKTNYSVFFPKSTLNSILEPSYCVGIKVIPGSRKFDEGGNKINSFKTMLIAGINSSLGNIDAIFYKSLEPCPTICPNDNLMLMPNKQ